jgi:ankyrin repeat protein
MTLFHYAAIYNDVRILDYAIKLRQHKTVDLGDVEGFTPAQNASYLVHLDVLNLLLENGADLHLKNQRGQTCFEQIVMNDSSELLDIVWTEAVQYQHT